MNDSHQDDPLTTEPASTDEVRDVADDEGGLEPVPIVVEPMSLSLIGKLFGVPLLIIGSIVGCAVVVVMLFGAPASPDARSIDSLLQSLEASSWGYREGVVLLPREKEPWQAALELAVRLEKQGDSISQEELKSVAERLGKLVMTDLDNLGRIANAEGDTNRAGPAGRFQFLIRALGQTDQDAAVDPLISIVGSESEAFACAAMQQLGNLHEKVPGARRAIPAMLKTLTRSPPAETRIMACTALSVLADAGNQEVIDALALQRAGGDGDVTWAAALALARLGSNEGKVTLLDLLDRSFWESGDRYAARDAAGVVHRYKMPAERIENLMIAAVDAAAHLEDADVWAAIEGLKNDKSPAVVAKATEVSSSRSTS